MNVVLLEALPWSKVDVSSNLAYLQVAMHPASFIDLLLQFLSPSLLHTLLDSRGVIECPPLTTIRLPDFLTGITAALLLTLSSIAAGEEEEEKVRRNKREKWSLTQGQEELTSNKFHCLQLHLSVSHPLPAATLVACQLSHYH